MVAVTTSETQRCDNVVTTLSDVATKKQPKPNVVTTSCASWVRRRLKDVFKTSWSRSIYSPWSYVFNTSSRCFQDVLPRRIQYVLQTVFKKSSRQLQDVLKIFWRHLQDTYKTSCQNIFTTSRKDVFKTCLRRLQNVSSC